MNITAEPAEILHKTVFVTLWLLALLLNVFSAVLLGRTAYLRATWSNILLLTLSLTDSFIVVTSGTIAIAALFKKSLLREYLSVCYLQGFFLNAYISFSCFIVAFIAVDRYVAVCYPFFYSRKILAYPPLKTILAMLLVLVIVGLLVAALPIVTKADYGPFNPPVFCWYSFTSTEIQNKAAASVNLLFLLIVLLVLFFCTIRICIGLYKEQNSLHKRVASEIPAAGGSRKRNHVQSNFAKLAAAISVVFLVCTVPHVVVVLIHLSSNHSSDEALYFTFILLLLNALLNPLLYATVKVTIRMAYKEAVKWILYWLCCCRMVYRPRGIDEVLGASHRHPAMCYSNPVASLAIRQHSQQVAEVQVPGDPCFLEPRSVAASSSSTASSTENISTQSTNEGRSILIPTIHVIGPPSLAVTGTGSPSGSSADTITDSFSFHSAGSYALKPQLVTAVWVTGGEHSSLAACSRLSTVQEEEEEEEDEVVVKE